MPKLLRKSDPMALSNEEYFALFLSARLDGWGRSEVMHVGRVLRGKWSPIANCFKTTTRTPCELDLQAETWDCSWNMKFEDRTNSGVGNTLGLRRTAKFGWRRT